MRRVSREKKPVVKTVRMTEEIYATIMKDAKSSGVSVNALISMILTRYVQWERYARALHYVSLSAEAFRQVLEAVEERRIIEVAQERGPRSCKAFMLYRFKGVSLQNFLKSMSLIGRYTGLFEYDEHADGSGCVVSLHHHLGGKWSTYLKHFIGQALKTELGIAAKVDVSQESVLFKFQAPAESSQIQSS